MSTPSPKDVLFSDLEREISITRRVLESLPPEHYAWKPHEKSMSMGQLALHVAELVEWMHGTLGADDYDVASAPPPPKVLNSKEELLKRFDDNVAALRNTVAAFSMDSFEKPWTLREGSSVIVTKPRSMVYKAWSFNHLIHHRAQLCIYLRLLNQPVPTVYFNTADQPNMEFV